MSSPLLAVAAATTELLLYCPARAEGSTQLLLPVAVLAVAVVEVAVVLLQAKLTPHCVVADTAPVVVVVEVVVVVVVVDEAVIIGRSKED